MSVLCIDDLASGAILGHAREGAHLVSVGKRAGRPSAKQEHVSRSVDYASTGARVVRLKSGDAGVFGRLEEEIEALKSEGIAYEIVPGVSSAFAADLNWGALADSLATTVAYMGKSTFSELAARLMEKGLSSATSALLAASWPRRSRATTIAGLADQLTGEIVSANADPG